jgi:hypothetical protein
MFVLPYKFGRLTLDLEMSVLICVCLAIRIFVHGLPIDEVPSKSLCLLQVGLTGFQNSLPAKLLPDIPW